MIGVAQWSKTLSHCWTTSIHFIIDINLGCFQITESNAKATFSFFAVIWTKGLSVRQNLKVFVSAYYEEINFLSGQMKVYCFIDKSCVPSEYRDTQLWQCLWKLSRVICLGIPTMCMWPLFGGLRRMNCVKSTKEGIDLGPRFLKDAKIGERNWLLVCSQGLIYLGFYFPGRLVELSRFNIDVETEHEVHQYAT